MCKEIKGTVNTKFSILIISESARKGMGYLSDT